MSIQELNDNKADNAFSNSGNVYSESELDITSKGNIDNTGSIAAQSDITIEGGSYTQSEQGQLIAGLSPEGELSTDSANLSINTTATQTNAGTTIAIGDITLDGSELDYSGSRIQSNNLKLSATEGDITLNQATAIAKGSAKIDAMGSLNNEQGLLQADNYRFSISNLNNRGGKIIQLGDQDFTLVTQSIDNHKGLIGSQGKDLTINSYKFLNNDEGKIVHDGKGNADVTANRMNNSKGKVVSTHSLYITSVSSLNNTEGMLQADTLTVDSNSLDNTQGHIVSHTGDLIVNSQSINNDGNAAFIQSGNALSLISEQLTNSNQAIISANGIANITVTKALDNRSGAVIASEKDMTIQVGTLTNDSQIASIDQNLHLVSDEIYNSENGKIRAKLANTIRVEKGLNNTGEISASTQLNIDSQGMVNNQQGVLLGGGIKLISRTGINNHKGLIAQTDADRVLIIDSQGAVDNHNTLIQEGQDSTQTGILANSSATIKATNVNNELGLISADILEISTSDQNSFNNQRGGFRKLCVTAYNPLTGE